MELFLDCMTEPNEKLVEFGIGGICNSVAGTLIWGKLVKALCFYEQHYFSLFQHIVFSDPYSAIWTDPSNAAVVSHSGGIPLIIQCLSSPVTNIVRIKCTSFLFSLLYIGLEISKLSFSWTILVRREKLT